MGPVPGSPAPHFEDRLRAACDASTGERHDGVVCLGTWSGVDGNLHVRLTRAGKA